MRSVPIRSVRFVPLGPSFPDGMEHRESILGTERYHHLIPVYCESVGILLYSFKVINYNMEKQNEGVEVVENGNDTLLRKTDAALFAWPWKNLGNYKAWTLY
ncbi:hypothetical protein H5410_018580 [Solanum commersonii]|uniref:Uncharacterized protein n=1 Tax=Solanum commersonii TaxID=4109 RepID=A0A9J6A3J5_SOLCO|nr:hypothetical protein H5410_018580 [Solanum commersonii]